MKNLFKKTVLVLLTILLAAAYAPINVFADTVSEPAFGINKLYLRAGENLSVNNPDNYDLKYYVDDTEIEGNTLTLKSNYYEKWITVKAYDGETQVAEDKVYFSKLPVIYINTEDGKNVSSKTDYKPADMSIQNNDNTGKELYNGTIDIKGRGNTTWKIYPKKPYKIKLDKKTDLFGMGKSKHWVLLGNYIDPCFMRNVSASELSHKLGVDTMDFVWTDLVLNGEYAGNYLLGEHVRIGKTRVDITDWEEEAESAASAIVKAEKANGFTLDKDALETIMKSNLNWINTGKVTFNEKEYNIADYYDYNKDTSGGYLFELSDEYDEVSKFTTNGGLKVMLKNPEYLNTNTDMMSYVKDYWDSFEKAYKSENGYAKYNGKNTHYTELADLDSMVGFWLVNEILGNNDAVYKSRYAYKAVGEKLKFGPTWDFDYGCGAFPLNAVPSGWKISKNVSDDKRDANFYKEFLDDPLFIAKASEKYWEVRPYLQSLIDDGGVIDTNAEYLAESGEADSSLWDRHYIFPKTAKTFEEDVKAFKAYLSGRIKWLDSQFKTDDALINSTRVKESAYPYENAKNKISVSLLNTGKDNAQNAAADGVLSSKKDLSLSVKVTDEDTSELKVYVNGFYNSTVYLKDNKYTFKISKENLTEPYDKKNVISFIGKDKRGDTTYKTFKTVKVFLDEADADSDIEEVDNINTFIPDNEDFNLEYFGLGIHSFKNYELLGLQLHKKDRASVRFVTVAQSDVLNNAKDYGYVFASESSDKTANDIKQNIDSYINEGRFISCKGTVNTVSMGNYGNSVFDKIEPGYTKYKYITASMSNIPGDKYVVSLFYIKTEDDTYFASYKDTQKACVFRLSDLA